MKGDHEMPTLAFGRGETSETAPEITKQKAGKPQWDKILARLPNALEAMVRVREYGNEKYARIAKEAGVAFDSESWRKNPPLDYLNSAARHLVALMRGERVNEQDGNCHHAAQAMIDLAFALEIELAEASAPATIPAPPPIEPAASAVRAYLWQDDGTKQPLIISHADDLPPLTALVETLARKQRWDGQCAESISIARHSVMVAKIALDLQDYGCSTAAQASLVRSALLHDAAEALYGDIPTPRKMLERAMLPKGVAHPNDLLTAAFNKHLEAAYGLTLNHPLIKRADAIAGCVEARARGVSEDELARWYPEACMIALSYNLDVVAWPAIDDEARWWAMWRSYGGDCYGV